MITNLDLAKNILDKLVSMKVREFVVCLGSRNIPFVKLLKESRDLSVFSFSEERSASFFALGRIKQTQLPVAIITTSGTAVAEVFPAIIEAFYSSIPLVVVSADRPKHFRKSGAPQSIEQKNIFLQYCLTNYDFDKDNEIKFKISKNHPNHINVCFDEPLIPLDLSPIPLDLSPIPLDNNFLENLDEYEDISNLNKAIEQIKNPIVILGGLPLSLERPIQDILSQWELPIYIEGSSGLREWKTDKKITSGDGFVRWMRKKNLFDSVIRIGSVPTLKFWRDLEGLENKVLNFSQNSFSGLGRLKTKPFSLFGSLEKLKEINLRNSRIDKIILENKKFTQELQKLILKYNASEVRFVYELSKKINESLFVGNSLPIREWDLGASFNGNFRKVTANRGANGIDGQISTYLATDCKFGIFGDLTTLYDLASLGLSKYIKDKEKQLVVINNFSGGIFNRAYEEDFFGNSHSLKFKYWAKMFSWDYLGCTNLEDIKKIPVLTEPTSKSFHRVIEVFPDKNESNLFWKEYDQFFVEK